MLLLPPSCTSCGLAGWVVCPACAAALRPPPQRPPPPGVDALVAPLAYEGPARHLVARLKYRNARLVAPVLAGAMAACLLRGPGLPVAPDTVCWVPTTPARRRRRGFDHGALLARLVAAELNLTCRPLLARRPGPPQTGRPAPARRAGPSLVASGPVAPTILVVDDIVTTGGSAAAAAAALRGAGATRVVVAAAALTPAPSARPAADLGAQLS